MRIFGASVVVAIAGVGVGFLYQGWRGGLTVAILAVLEVSLSFDNAIVNAKILGCMSLAWRRLFLTVGILIAVVGMRLLFPLLLVAATAHLSPVSALRLAFAHGDPKTPGTYGYLLNHAHPAIAAFGAVFLAMLFLDFIFETREPTWLTWIERPLQRIGRLDQLSVVLVLLGVTACAAWLVPEDAALTVAIAGSLGLIVYLLVNGVTGLFLVEEDAALAVGGAGLALFLYLEVIDGSFSFDGVVGAFAISVDPIVIAIGLGVGAMFTRSITVHLVRTGTLAKFVFLEHGAMWAIGLLAVLLGLSLRYDVPDVVTGLSSVCLIAAALASSVVRNRRALAAPS